MHYRFEWDFEKAKLNVVKHGISFENASLAFYDPMALRLPDVRHSTQDEEREILIGQVAVGVLVIVYTVRQPDDGVRIISARRANRKERRLYYET